MPKPRTATDNPQQRRPLSVGDGEVGEARRRVVVHKESRQLRDAHHEDQIEEEFEPRGVPLRISLGRAQSRWPEPAVRLDHLGSKRTPFGQPFVDGIASSEATLDEARSRGYHGLETSSRNGAAADSAGLRQIHAKWALRAETRRCGPFFHRSRESRRFEDIPHSLYRCIATEGRTMNEGLRHE